MKQAKQRRDSIDEYEKADRGELAAVEKTELAVIEKYLPQMMSREEVEIIAKQVITDVGVTDPRGMGKVMGRLMGQLKAKRTARL